MFDPWGEVRLMLSFATVGISFLFRPFGAFLAGHLGDRVGRRAVLVVTLIGMVLQPQQLVCFQRTPR